MSSKEELIEKDKLRDLDGWLRIKLSILTNSNKK